MNIEYATRRLNRLRCVALHIDRHLFDPLRLGDLADVAALSRYHFERVFAEYAGETPVARVRRLRLAQARRKLVAGSATNILELALDCGYGSLEAFSRAFRQQFGHAPSRCVPPLPALPLHRRAFTLCELPALEIQYLPFSGRLDEALLPFDELRARAMAQGIPRERRKGWAVHLNHRAELWGGSARLQAALLSRPLGERIKGLALGRLPAGPYAVFNVEGSYDALPREQIERDLAAHGEWRVADAPVLRRFDNPTYLPAEHERRFSLFVPLVR